MLAVKSTNYRRAQNKGVIMEHSVFMEVLSGLLNRACCENVSNTPDFILAQFMQSCLAAFEAATINRDKWYGVHLEPAYKFFINEEDAPAENQGNGEHILQQPQQSSASDFVDGVDQ
jgi:hypothetical protein